MAAPPMAFDLPSLIRQRHGENYTLHERHLNRTLVAVQRTIGFDKVYTRAEGAYLYDAQGRDYLDFLSGFAVYNIGRNHPVVKKALADTLAQDLPNLVQMDCSLLSGLLGEALLARLPDHLGAVFFCNSGTEAVEGAIKFARAATGRTGLLSLEGSFHGLTMGALSIMGCEAFCEGFGPGLPECHRVPLGDLAALEEALATGQYAAFILEPVQGKGVHFAEPAYYKEAQWLCQKYGTLLVCDEVQTGLGRTGRWFGFEHWGLEPDIVTVAKSLSGGYVPCAAVATRRSIFQQTYSRMDRCVVHSSTFGRNNLAMAAGLATLHVLEEEGLVANAERMGLILKERLQALRQRHSLIREVRGVGLMLAIEFQQPAEFTARLGWRLIHAVEPALFAQMVVTRLLSRHRILTHVAAHGRDEIKLLPPLIITEREVDRFVQALDAVLHQCARFPGPIWELGANFLRTTLHPSGR